MFIDNRLGLLESLETMRAHEERLNKITNNLAQADTTGYKKDGVTFWEMLYNTSTDRQRVGKAVKSTTDFQEGPAQETGNPFDLAINGDGFFKVQTPDGIRYTRAGHFQPNQEGQLITPHGYLVLGDGGPVTINGKQVAVGRDGSVVVDGKRVTQFDIVTFDDPAVLEKQGTNLFRLKDPAAQEQQPQRLEVRQGFLEKSNVNTVEEMTAMIDLLRAYEGQQQMIKAVDDMDSLAIRRVGSLTE